MRHASSASGGFTLVELLVTVAVIGVLIAVLVPALASARQSSMQVIGASNIRQLALANIAFAEDHDGRYVPAAVGMMNDNLHRWHGSRASVGEPFEPASGAISQYLGADAVNGAVRACPRFAPTLDALKLSGRGFESGSGGYGYNAAFVGSVRSRTVHGTWTVARDDVGSRMSRFRRHSETLMFADAAFASGTGLGGEWGGVIEYSFAEPARWPQYAAAFAPDPSIHFRHNGAANIAWLDGHVSQERRDHTSWSYVYEQDPEPAMLGWFTEPFSNAVFDYE